MQKCAPDAYVEETRCKSGRLSKIRQQKQTDEDLLPEEIYGCLLTSLVSRRKVREMMDRELGGLTNPRQV